MGLKFGLRRRSVTVGVVEVVLSAVVAVLCIAFAELYTVHRPSEDAVYDASILSGRGDE
jgi:hypothetical protein